METSGSEKTLLTPSSSFESNSFATPSSSLPSSAAGTPTLQRLPSILKISPNSSPTTPAKKKKKLRIVVSEEELKREKAEPTDSRESSGPEAPEAGEESQGETAEGNEKEKKISSSVLSEKTEVLQLAADSAESPPPDLEKETTPLAAAQKVQTETEIARDQGVPSALARSAAPTPSDDQEDDEIASALDSPTPVLEVSVVSLPQSEASPTPVKLAQPRPLSPRQFLSNSSPFPAPLPFDSPSSFLSAASPFSNGPYSPLAAPSPTSAFASPPPLRTDSPPPTLRLDADSEPSSPTQPGSRRKPPTRITRHDRQISVSASEFLRDSYYLRGSLKVLGSKRLFSPSKSVPYFWILTAHTMEAFRAEDDLIAIRGLQCNLKDIKAIRWSPAQAEREAYFTLEFVNGTQWVLSAESPAACAKWIICIDSIACNLHNKTFETLLEPLTDKHSLLEFIYLHKYRGGVIKSSYLEEWQYEPNGTVTCLESEREGNKNMKFTWDGERFLPAAQYSETQGAGHWTGVFLAWYLKEWMTFKSGKREKFLKYFYSQAEREYIPENQVLTKWKWTRHFLASKFNEGEWIVEGDVPEPVVMFLQLFRYSQVGYNVNLEEDKEVDNIFEYAQKMKQLKDMAPKPTPPASPAGANIASLPSRSSSNPPSKLNVPEDGDMPLWVQVLGASAVTVFAGVAAVFVWKKFFS